MIHAYNNNYLYTVMGNLAALFDLAINAEGILPCDFQDMFSSSVVAKKIESAVPDILAGKSASEMLAMIQGKSNQYYFVPESRTPEYWAGWVLADVQWSLNKSFEEIFKVCSLEEFIKLYYPYHEADERKTVELVKSRLASTDSQLKLIRKRCKLTQAELAEKSGVNIRSIRSYEQGDNEISKAQAETVAKIASVLECTVEELI